MTRQTKAELEARLEAYKQMHVEAELRAEDVNEKLKNVKRELRDTQENLGSALGNAVELEKNQASMETQLQGTKHVLSERGRELRDVKENLEHAEMRIQDQNARLEFLADLKANLQTALQGLSDRQDELETANELVGKLKGANDELARELERSERELRWYVSMVRAMGERPEHSKPTAWKTIWEDS